MKTNETDVTEIVELSASKVSGVTAPANSTPFLLLKAAAPQVCSTCKGKGTILEGNRDCPDCDGAEKSDSAEADALLEEATGEAAKALSAADRKAMPASSFAFVDKNGDKHLPIHDEGHVIAAKGRVGQTDFSEAKGDPADAKATAESKISAAAKKLGIGAKKGAVQDALGGLATPQEVGHLETGQSKLGPAVTAGTKPVVPAADQQGGASSYEIPDEVKVISKGVAVASLVEAMDALDEQRAAVKDGVTIQVDGVTSPTVPLSEVASTLASCARTVEEYLLCERVEAAIDSNEQSDVWAMEDAVYALQSAFKLVANIAFLESLEGEGTVTKAGKVLSAKNVAALEAAHKHLTGVIEAAKDKASSASETADKETLVTELTKSELAESIAAGVKEVLKAEREAEKVEQAEKAEKLAAAKALIAEEAEKGNVDGGPNTGGSQSNNNGEISEADIKPTKETDSNDINAVKDEKGEEGEATKAESDTPDEFTKQVETQLEALTKGQAALQELVTKIAKRPRPGGPSLDGQGRGIAPASEGRQGDATKGEGDEIESLVKSLEGTKDPTQKQAIGYRLAHARLMKAHETGQL